MSLTYFQGLEVSASASSAPADSAQPNSSSKMRPADEYCTSTGPAYQSTTTSPPSSHQGDSTLSVVASHAKISHSQARGQACKERGQGSGSSTCESLKKPARSGSSSKTLRPFGSVDSIKSYPASQRSGITLDGIAYPRPALAVITKGTGSGLLPTPRASEWKGCGPKGSKSHNHWLQHFYLTAVVSDSGKLNPTFAEAIMGFPPGWTDV